MSPGQGTRNRTAVLIKHIATAPQCTLEISAIARSKRSVDARGDVRRLAKITVNEQTGRFRTMDPHLEVLTPLRSSLGI